MTQDEDLFTLIIKNPEPGDSGRYTCVIRECNDLTCKVVLDVERKNLYILHDVVHHIFSRILKVGIYEFFFS